MDITGRLIKILPEASGESARGKWVRGGFVIETDDAFPKQVAFTCFGEEKIAMIHGLVLNSTVVVTFSPESREYQDRWYTDLRCIRVQAAATIQMPTNTAATTSNAPFAQPPAPAMPPAMPTGGDSNDDLPF